MCTDTVCEKIKQYLFHESEPVNQDTLIADICDTEMCSRNEVLAGLRKLMQKNQISYSIDYKLQLDSRGEPFFPDQH